MWMEAEQVLRALVQLAQHGELMLREGLMIQRGLAVARSHPGLRSGFLHPKVLLVLLESWKLLDKVSPTVAFHEQTLEVGVR